MQSVHVYYYHYLLPYNIFQQYYRGTEPLVSSVLQFYSLQCIALLNVRVLSQKSRVFVVPVDALVIEVASTVPAIVIQCCH